MPAEFYSWKESKRISCIEGRQGVSGSVGIPGPMASRVVVIRLLSKDTVAKGAGIRNINTAVRLHCISSGAIIRPATKQKCLLTDRFKEFACWHFNLHFQSTLSPTPSCSCRFSPLLVRLPTRNESVAYYYLKRVSLNILTFFSLNNQLFQIKKNHDKTPLSFTFMTFLKTRHIISL